MKRLDIDYDEILTFEEFSKCLVLYDVDRSLLDVDKLA